MGVAEEPEEEAEESLVAPVLPELAPAQGLYSLGGGEGGGWEEALEGPPELVELETVSPGGVAIGEVAGWGIPAS
jgi:hypothetical protein